jgi:hypothetical protein
MALIALAAIFIGAGGEVGADGKIHLTSQQAQEAILAGEGLNNVIVEGDLVLRDIVIEGNLVLAGTIIKGDMVLENTDIGIEGDLTIGE